MTTGQRKQVKRLIGEYPELTCESYGFGQERQLHLFKRQHAVEPSPTPNTTVANETPCKFVKEPAETAADQLLEGVGSAVSIKNASIENDLDGEGYDESGAMATMPDVLSHKALSPCTEVKIKSETPSTAISSDHSTSGSPTLTPRAERQLASPIAIALGTPVRNTFIHYAQTADVRSVQSMPHGMFGRCLLSESVGQGDIQMREDFQASTAATPTVRELRPAVSALTPLCDIDVHDDAFTIGAEVCITGLSKLPTFNGLKGTIQSFDQETGRFSILLFEPVGGHKWVKVKRENLDPVEPLPPPMSPLQVTPTWEEYQAHALNLTALV